jgi:ubiquinone/menaquinone biosynthesis C-methylase UbiE
MHSTEHRPHDAPGGDRSMTTDDVADVYADKADAIHRFDRLDRLLTGRYRDARFGDVSGRVLDVACGTGTNFPYVPASADLVGIDVSPAMLEKARGRLERLGRDGEVRRMDAAALAFEDDRFDAVISALSTCTFPEPVAALREMERVVRPGGTIRLVEHGRSSVGPVARFQDWRADAHYAKMGCRWNQDPRALVEAAGLDVRDVSTGMLGIVTTFEIAPSS